MAGAKRPFRDVEQMVTDPQTDENDSWEIRGVKQDQAAIEQHKIMEMLRRAALPDPFGNEEDAKHTTAHG